MRRGNLKEEVQLDDLGVNGRIILKHMLKEWGWTVFGSGQGQVVDFLGSGNGQSGSTKFGKFLE
jgi:hypothetical protein